MIEKDPYKYVKTVLSKPITWVMVDQLLVSGINFITTFILAHGLPVSDFARYSGIVLAQMFMLTMQNALVLQPFQLFLYRLPGKSCRHTAWWAGFIFITVGLIGMHAARHFFEQGGILTKTQAMYSLCCIEGYLLMDLIRRMLIAEKKITQSIIIDAISNIPQLIVLAYLFYAKELTLDSGLKTISVTYIPAVLVGIFFLQPRFQSLPTFFRIYKMFWKESRWLTATGLLQWSSGNYLVVAATYYIGAQALAAVRLGQSILGVVGVFLQASENYVLPKAAQMLRVSPYMMWRYVKHYSIGLILISLVISSTLFFFSKPIFFAAGGSQFVEYSSVLQWFALLLMTIAISYPFRILIRVHMQNAHFLVGYIFTTLFSLLAAKWLCISMGMAGVVIGLMFNQIVMVIYWTIILKRKKQMAWTLPT
jgi:O-antigen/teichoic acid export membrane protein